jgi:hypothetical protein
MGNADVKTRILHRLGAKANLGVWTPVDFLDMGSRLILNYFVYYAARSHRQMLFFSCKARCHVPLGSFVRLLTDRVSNQ